MLELTLGRGSVSNLCSLRREIRFGVGGVSGFGGCEIVAVGFVCWRGMSVREGA
jgi:hypothetical protein